jgi:hypothetical protein
MDFNKIYINGCSMTYGDGLDVNEYDDDNHQWWEKKGKPIGNYPQNLSEIYKVPVIDESRVGGSNQRILRKTFNYIVNSNDLENTLFLIQWTYPLRYEKLISGRWFQVIIKEKHFVDSKQEDIELSKYYAKLAGIIFEDDDGLIERDMIIQLYLKKIQYIILLQLLFQKYGVKYLMYNGHDYYDSKMNFKYPDFLRVVSAGQDNIIDDKLHFDLINEIDDTYFLSEQVVDIFGENQIENFYRGHGNEDGHKKFTDYLVREINKK